MFTARNWLEPYYQDSKKLDRDFKIAAESSAEDIALFEWLARETEVWPVLGPVFERRLNLRKGFARWLKEAGQTDFELNAAQKRVGAFFVVLELREFGGHTLWNRLKESPHYEDIIRQVHERVAGRFKKPFPDAMSVEDREISLCAMMLGESLEQLSPSKVSQLLKDANFETLGDLKELRKSLLTKLNGGSLSSFKGMLGKLVAKRFGAALIESAWGLPRLAGVGRIGSLASRVLPFALRRAGLYLSLGFLLKDAYQLGGEATRVTNPAIIIIALYRSLGDPKEDSCSVDPAS